jgi:hypothetical protein
MFAATDVDTARRVYLFIRLENGIEREIAIGEAYRDPLERARGLPTDAWLTRLAAATSQAVEDEPELDLSSQPVSLPWNSGNSVLNSVEHTPGISGVSAPIWPTLVGRVIE